MNEETRGKQPEEPDPRHKMDGVLRRLLELEDAALRKRVTQDRQRLTRLKKRIADEVIQAVPGGLDRYPVGAKREDVSSGEVEQIRSHLIQLRERELLPNRIAALVEIGRASCRERV